MTVIRLYPRAQRFSINGQLSKPSYATYGLVELLALRLERLVPYADLAAHMWRGGQPDDSMNTLKVTLWKVRMRWPELQIKTYPAHGLQLSGAQVFLHRGR